MSADKASGGTFETRRGGFRDVVFRRYAFDSPGNRNKDLPGCASLRNKMACRAAARIRQFLMSGFVAALIGPGTLTSVLRSRIGVMVARIDGCGGYRVLMAELKAQQRSSRRSSR